MATRADGCWTVIPSDKRDGDLCLLVRRADVEASTPMQRDSDGLSVFRCRSPFKLFSIGHGVDPFAKVSLLQPVVGEATNPVVRKLKEIFNAATRACDGHARSELCIILFTGGCYSAAASAPHVTICITVCTSVGMHTRVPFPYLNSSLYAPLATFLQIVKV